MSLPASFTAALPAMAAAAAANGGSDYKALVYLMLNGGNDCHNTVIPTGAGYAAYAAGRPTLALADGSNLALAGVSDAKLHPNLTGLRTIFDAGKCAIVCNVGTLVRPITKAQKAAKTVPVPFQIESHSDQIAQWQTGDPVSTSATGWGGRATDLMAAAFNPSATVAMSVSASGNPVHLTGHEARSYNVGQSGPVAISRRTSYSGHAPAAAALTTILAQNRTHPLEVAYLTTVQGSVANQATVASAIGSATMNVTFPTTSLGNQLKMVARMIRGRAALSARRHVFFVSLGGFDNHTNLLVDHAALMLQVGDAVKAFYDEMVAQSLSNQVTLATGSDFGRSLRENGSGSDHGWGGHHFVVGGAVAGGRLYSKVTNASEIGTAYTDVSIGGPYDYNNGRMVPTISLDEYGATLSKWLGVPDAVSNGVNPMELIWPNLPRFGHRDLGFMTS